MQVMGNFSNDNAEQDGPTGVRKNFLRLFFPMVVILIFVFIAFELVRIQAHNIEIKTEEINHVRMGRNSIERDLEYLGNDLAVLADSEILARFLTTNSAKDRQALAERYRTFAVDRRIYDQIRFLDVTGMEIVRINYSDGKAQIVSTDKLQNKGQRYYFKESLARPQGSAYISQLDLNIENQKVEVPHKPMLRIGQPIFDAQGQKRGVIILNYLADQMFKRYEASMPSDIDENFILNSDGFWLYSPIPNKAWGFMFGRPQSFVTEHPQAWRKLIASEAGFFETSHGFFAFTTINPSQYIQKGAGTSSLTNVWKVGSVLSTNQLNVQNHLHRHYPDLIIFSLSLILAASGSWRFSLATMARKTAEDRLRETLETAKLLEKIAAAANAAPHAEKAMQTALDLVCEHTQWPIGHVYCINSNGELYSANIWHLDYPASFNAFRIGTIDHKFPDNKGLPGRVLASRKPVWIADLSDFKHFSRAHLATELNLKSAFAFPVIVDNDVIAILEFFSQKAFDKAPILSDVTAQIGSHIGSVVERDHAKKQILTIKEEAEKANLYKSEFLASMSHELRTPLNAVLGFAQMLQFDPKAPLSPTQNESIECILAGGNHLLELVNEILDLAKIEADQMPLYIEDVNANAIVADCISLSRPLGEARGIVIIDQFSTDPIFTLRTDRLRFKQSVINLLSNAVKYNRDGGTVTVSGYEDEKQFLHLSVADTGVGIENNDSHSIFDMFNRLGADTMIAQEGTGIGLTVTKLLIEHMAGRIGFESEKDIGSTFWIKLPLTSNQSAVIWTETFNIGIEAIDKDHQILFTLLNDVTHSSMNEHDIDMVLGKLINYTCYHFKREEAIMAICGYPDLESHKGIHQKLASQANELAQKWNQDRNPETVISLRMFLREWLINHIKQVDTEIYEYAKDNQQIIHNALKKID